MAGARLRSRAARVLLVLALVAGAATGGWLAWLELRGPWVEWPVAAERAEQFAADVAELRRLQEVQLGNERFLERAAEAWLTAEAGAAASPRQLPSSLQVPSAAAGLDRVRTELAPVPRRFVKVRANVDIVRDDDGAVGEVAVEARVATSLVPAARRPSRHDLVLRAIFVADGDAGDHVVSSWRLLRVGVQDAGGLYAFDDPVFLTGSSVLVVAERVELATAERVRDQAVSDLADLSRRYAALEGPAEATIFVVRGGEQAARVVPGLGQTADVYGAVTSGGDVMIDLARHEGEGSWVLPGTVRHEMAHIALTPIDRAPHAFVEGVASWEGSMHVFGLRGDLYRDFSAELASVRSGKAPLRRHLTQRWSYREHDAGLTDYGLGEAMVASIVDDHGIDGLVAVLERLPHDQVGAALSTGIGIGVTQLERQTESWLASNVTWSG